MQDTLNRVCSLQTINLPLHWYSLRHCFHAETCTAGHGCKHGHEWVLALMWSSFSDSANAQTCEECVYSVQSYIRTGRLSYLPIIELTEKLFIINDLVVT